MAQVRILLMPQELRFNFMFITAEKAEILGRRLDDYLLLPPVTLEVDGDGQELAQEVFDLTNNPGRQDERMEVYGNGRSLSSGDVVRTDEGDFLCCSIGWVKL